MQCAALQGRLSTTSVFHFGQRQTRPKRDSFLQFGCFSKVSTSKQSNQIEAIGYGIASIWTSPSKIYKNTAILWGLLINYDNFSGKLTRIVHLCTNMCKKTMRFQNLFYLKRAGEFSRVNFKQKPGSPIFPVIPSIFASPGVYIYIYVYILVLMCIHRYISVRVSLCVHLDEFKSNGEGVGQFCQKHPSTPKNMFQKVSSPFALAGSLVH